MDESRYVEAFKKLKGNFSIDSNARLFKLAKTAYETLGRGAISILYTSLDDVETAFGTSPASYVPAEVVKAEDGEKVAEMCASYNPKKQFVVTVNIGQNNELDAQVAQESFIIDYLGDKVAAALARDTISLDELDHRLEKAKSWPCDSCHQRRKLHNLIRDPVIGKLVYCNVTCYQNHLTNGAARLIHWYMTERPKFRDMNAVEATKATERQNLVVSASVADL